MGRNIMQEFPHAYAQRELYMYIVSSIHHSIKFSYILPGEDVDLSRYTDVKIITGVLKQFLRELPQPVISHDAYSQITRATGECYLLT